MSRFTTEEIREVVRRQNGGMTRDEATEAARKASTIAAVRAVAARLDGSATARLSVATGFTPEEIEDLGGMPEERCTRRTPRCETHQEA